MELDARTRNMIRIATLIEEAEAGGAREQVLSLLLQMYAAEKVKIIQPDYDQTIKIQGDALKRSVRALAEVMGVELYDD